jgi:hypothetical protein
MTFIVPPKAPINPNPPIGPISMHGAGLLEASKIKVNQAGSRSRHFETFFSLR